MTRAARFVLVSAGSVAVAVVLSLTSAGPALAQTFKPVMSMIVNDSAHPVPVVAAEPLPVIDAGAAAQPFQQLVRGLDPHVIVPDGKQLVIEFYSGDVGSTPADCVVHAMNIQTSLSTDPDLPREHRLIPVLVATGPALNSYTISQQVRLYAGPGTTVTFSPLKTPRPDCVAEFLGVVSGYLVDAH